MRAGGASRARGVCGREGGPLHTRGGGQSEETQWLPISRVRGYDAPTNENGLETELCCFRYASGSELVRRSGLASI
jgi:hypothetical protein